MAVVREVLTTFALFLGTRSLALQVPSPPTDIAIEDINDQVGDSICDGSMLESARSHLAQANLGALRSNPCIADDDPDNGILQQLENGERDAADNFEFLGTAVDEAAVVRYSLPKFLFIGIPHSGSTSLAEQLNMHDELTYGKMKEHNMLYRIGLIPNALFRSTYQSTFPVLNSTVKYTFDASPATLFVGNEDDGQMKKMPIGTTYGPGEKSVKAIQQVLGGKTKMIVMLRNPLDWQVSMTQKTAHTLDTMLGNHSTLSDRSCYVNSVKSWLAVFPKSQFLFLMSEEYFANPQGVLNKVFAFLGVKGRVYDKKELEAQGRRRSTRPVSARMRAEFWADEQATECRRELERIANRPFPWHHMTR